VDTHRLETARTGRYHTLGDAARAREVWFLLHGYGQSAADLLASCAALATPKRLLVAPEGLSRFYLRGGTGPVGASWMTREDREHEIADTLGWLDRVAAEFDDAAHPRVRCAMGFSQGAAAACRWAALGRTNLDRLVLWGGGGPPARAAPAPGARPARSAVGRGASGAGLAPAGRTLDPPRRAAL
jgi:predicted esterase